MMNFTAGDPEMLAIDAELEEPVDPHWLSGHFRLTARGEALGDWEDVAMVRGIVAWWERFISSQKVRWDTRLEGLSPSQVFKVLCDAVFGDASESDWRSADDTFVRYHINRLGMSAFDSYAVLLVEPPEKGQWLLWRYEGGVADVGEIHVAVLPAGTMQAVGDEFVKSVREVFPEDPSPSAEERRGVGP